MIPVLYFQRRFPDFSYIGDGDLTELIDCVLISHFHLDHCGALPHFTEMVGYSGPIYMSYPTKAISPILLVSNIIHTLTIYAQSLSRWQKEPSCQPG